MAIPISEYSSIGYSAITESGNMLRFTTDTTPTYQYINKSQSSVIRIDTNVYVFTDGVSFTRSFTTVADANAEVEAIRVFIQNVSNVISGAVAVTGVVTNTPIAYSYNYISSATTTTVFSGSGTLVGVTFGKQGTAFVLTIYDNTAGSGTVVAVLSPTAPVSLPFGITLSIGCTIVSTATVAGSATVIYKQ